MFTNLKLFDIKCWSCCNLQVVLFTFDLSRECFPFHY